MLCMYVDFTFSSIGCCTQNDLVSEALDSNHEHICRFLTEYNVGVRNSTVFVCIFKFSYNKEHCQCDHADVCVLTYVRTDGRKWNVRSRVVSCMYSMYTDLYPVRMWSVSHCQAGIRMI